MTVYVDDARIPMGLMRMSHMIADGTEELLTMADRIEVARRHLQHAGMPDEHFDVSWGKRQLAVKLGAVPVTQRELVHIIRDRRRPDCGPDCVLKRGHPGYHDRGEEDEGW